MRRHATFRSRVIEREDSIGRAARFEGSNLLKIFALKKQGRPARVIQPRIRQDGCAMNVWTNPFVCCANVIQIEKDYLAILRLGDFAHKDTVTSL